MSNPIRRGFPCPICGIVSRSEILRGRHIVLNHIKARGTWSVILPNTWGRRSRIYSHHHCEWCEDAFSTVMALAAHLARVDLLEHITIGEAYKL